MTDLGLGPHSGAYGINANGQIVGCAGVNSGAVHAFLYDLSKGMTDLGTLGGSIAMAYAVSGNRQVAGYSAVVGSSNVHAFLYTPGSE